MSYVYKGKPHRIVATSFENDRMIKDNRSRMSHGFFRTFHVVFDSQPGCFTVML